MNKDDENNVSQNEAEQKAPAPTPETPVTTAPAQSGDYGYHEVADGVQGRKVSPDEQRRRIAMAASESAAKN